MFLSSTPRADLFRLLGDEDRLRLLALCAEEELTVGELASLLNQSQPQITKKSQPLREAGLLTARRDGTRTLLKGHVGPDPIVRAAFDEGRTLCMRDGSLARISITIAQRDEQSRRFFDERAPDIAEQSAVTLGLELSTWLPILAPLLPGRDLAIDVGTGEGTLLPLLSPLYERVIAIDRSPARLARCAARIAALGLPNVRLREGDVSDGDLRESVADRGGADIVVMARVLHHSSRPQEAISAAARLLKPSGYLVLVDYLPHQDETKREQGDVWLGFEPGKLRTYIESASLELISLAPFATDEALPVQLAVGRRPRPIA